MNTTMYFYLQLKKQEVINVVFLLLLLFLIVYLSGVYNSLGFYATIRTESDIQEEMGVPQKM